MNRPLYIVYLISILLCFERAFATEEVQVLSYYTYPPFSTSDSTGLSYDFVSLLNQHSEGRYNFVLKHYPRKRIDLMLEEERKVVVLFVHWSWMKDKDRTKYLWTGPILKDKNQIISHRDNPVNFDGTANSLHGHILGGIHGRQYKGLMASIDSGFIVRVDVNSEEQNINKLELQRIDVMTIPQSMLNYFYIKDSLHSFVYISPVPHSTYSRHVLVPLKEKELHNFLNSFVLHLKNNKEWYKIKKKYNL